MNIHLQLLLLLLCSPIIIFILHALITHLLHWQRWDVSRQLVAFSCVILGHLPLGLLIWLIVWQQLTKYPPRLFWTIVYTLLLYNAIGFIYFNLFNMSETALRVRIAREIAVSPLFRDVLAKRYGRQASIKVRLQRLIALNQIEQHGERYLLKSGWVYWMAWLFWAWSRVLGYDEQDNGYPQPGKLLDIASQLDC